MRGREYLKSIRDLRFRIEDMEKEAENIRISMITVKSTSDYSDRVQTSPRQDSLENQVIRILEKMDKINESINRKRAIFIKRQHEARENIRSLPEGQRRRFLIDYYIEGKKISDIAKEYNFTDYSSPYQLDRRAIQLYEEYYDKK